MSTRLALRIQDCFESLTPSQRRLATLLLERQEELLGYQATELARLAGVSKATAARLFRSLGYKDFNEVRLQAREERNRIAPMFGVTSVSGNSASNSLAIHLKQDLLNLTRTLESLRPDLLAQAIELLIVARRIWVAGFGTEDGLARYTRLLLARLKPDVRLFGGGGSLAEDLALVGPQDALLVIAMRPRQKLMQPILEFAETARANIIYLTDPVAANHGTRMAHVVVPCHNLSTAPFPSCVSVLSVVNFLANGVTAKLGVSAHRRLELINEIHEEIEDLAPEDLR